VLSALQDSMGVSATVGNVLEFANIALAGEETYDATLKGVWHAVKNLNRGFKRCRFLVYCQQDSVVVIDVKHSTDGGASGGGRDAVYDGALALSVTSPARSMSLVHYSVPEPSIVSLVVYNVAGRRMAVLEQGARCSDRGVSEIPLRADGFPSGVYFVRMSAVGVDTGALYSQTAKLLVLR
jgi:hypothetical protein